MLNKLSKNLALIGNKGELGKCLESKLSRKYLIFGNNKFKIQARRHAVLFAKQLPRCQKVIICAGNTRYRCKTRYDFSSHLRVVKWMEHILNTIHAKYVLFISSTSVYGENRSHCLTDEKTRPHPFTTYSKIKLKAERVITNICKKNHIKLCIVRLPIVVGENTRTSFPTPQSIKQQILSKKNTYLFPSSMLPKRPYLTINEFAEIVQKIIKQKITGIYNIVPDQSIRLIDLCCRLKAPKKIIIKFSGNYYPPDQSFSNRKIKDALNIRSIKGLTKL